MDFLVIAFSTFLGAFVAFTVERVTRVRDAALLEEAALNNLILDLAAKRVFIVSHDWDWADGEIDKVVHSILNVRELIRDARKALRPRSRALPHLRQMTMACNTFLEHSERGNNERLKFALKKLVSNISREVTSIHDLRPTRIVPDEPGRFAVS